MRWQPITYNGSTIHGTAYAARSGAAALDMLNMPPSDAQFVSRGLDTNPYYAGAERRPREFSIIFERKGTGVMPPTQAQVGAMVETLKGVFWPSAEGTLVCQNLDGTGGTAQYSIVCACLESVNIAYPTAEFRFVAADPRFYGASVTTSGTLASSPGTITVTVNGNENSQPIIRITPTGAKSGDYGYKLPIVTYNQSDTALTAYPVDLATDSASGVWSTTAMVSGGTVQADGDDLRLMVGGAEQDRWLAGMNSGTTHVWANLNYQPYSALIIKTAVSAAGTPSTIYFKKSPTALAALRRMPPAGELYNPATGERLTYTYRSSVNYTVTPQYRGIKGSSAGTIPVGGTLIWLDNNDVWFYYSNATAEAPVTDDTVKPVFNLSSSNNTSWVYAEFADAAAQMAAAWKPAIVAATSTPPSSTSSQVGRRSKTYTADHGGTADPASEMGLSIAAWVKANAWKAEDAVIEWRFFNPCGVTTVTVTGEKYRASTSWPEVMGLQKSRDARAWASVWNEAAPGTAATYTNLTANGSAYSLGGTFPYIRIAADGAVAAGSANFAAIEISDVTLALASANTPIVKRGAQQSNYMANFTIYNATTGKGFTFTGLVGLNQTITIDCQAQTVTYGLDGSDLQSGLVLDSARTEWLDLVPGANTITYTDAGMGNVVVQITAQDEMV